jgi:hypothetical protein
LSDARKKFTDLSCGEDNSIKLIYFSPQTSQNNSQHNEKVSINKISNFLLLVMISKQHKKCLTIMQIKGNINNILYTLGLRCKTGIKKLALRKHGQEFWHRSPVLRAAQAIL